MKTQDTWDPEYSTRSPIFDTLAAVSRYFRDFQNWPEITDYQRVFSEQLAEIRPVEQAAVINSFEEQYEPRVYLKQELQTRTENWHDFFNALIWLSFPQTKKTLNALHFQQASQRSPGSNRSLLENRITQFDECGAIIISDQQYLLDLISGHRWEELFIDHADAFEQHIRCIVFGHAIYEKALAPYIGMTCHSLLINDKDLLDYSNISLDRIDQKLADIWQQKIQYQPEKFAAYPLLGTPGFWPNQTIDFYKNTKYFRKHNNIR